MIRHLAWVFQRTLQIHPHSHIMNSSFAVGKMCFARSFVKTAKASVSSIPHVNSTETDTNDNAADAHAALGSSVDSEYVPLYPADRERTRMSKNKLVEALKSRFRLSPADVKLIITDDVVLRAHKERDLLVSLETLCMEGVSRRSFIDNPWLITLDKKRLDQKLTYLHSLPMRDINHFVPFLRLTVPRMRKLIMNMNRERDTIPTGNRVYYISDQVKLDPYTISKYLSKRLFVLEMSFDMFEQNLRNMLEYKVDPKDVLRDLWAFRYTPRSVQLRLERARCAKKDKIMPWMVRCPEPILQRSLKLAMDESAVLGDKTSNIEYVAERLGFETNEAKAIMTKHPQVFRVRVPKIKEVLDYLLDDAGFSRIEVAQVPRILCHSLKTTKSRLEELKAVGCRPSSLVIVCRSKREYSKFLKSWTESVQK